MTENSTVNQRKQKNLEIESPNSYSAARLEKHDLIPRILGRCSRPAALVNSCTRPLFHSSDADEQEVPEKKAGGLIKRERCAAAALGGRCGRWGDEAGKRKTAGSWGDEARTKTTAGRWRQTRRAGRSQREAREDSGDEGSGNSAQVGAKGRESKWAPNPNGQPICPARSVAHEYMHVHMHIHVCMHVYMHVYIYVYKNLCIQNNIYVHV